MQFYPKAIANNCGKVTEKKQQVINSFAHFYYLTITYYLGNIRLSVSVNTRWIRE